MKYFKTLFFLVLLSWTVTVILAPLVGAISDAFGLGNETAIGNISAIFLTSQFLHTLQSQVPYEEGAEFEAERHALVDLIQAALGAGQDAPPGQHRNERLLPLLYLANTLFFVLFTVSLVIYFL
jgi:hypothetical protein